jgi:hypothetical protein
MPIWLYVSVTGVVIYLMLYHFYPGSPREPIMNEAGATASA